MNQLIHYLCTYYSDKCYGKKKYRELLENQIGGNVNMLGDSLREWGDTREHELGGES